MSKTIDEKVVSIKLDNSNFEQNAQKTINSMNKLDSSLSLQNGSEKAEKSLEGVIEKFNALDIAGASAIASLTNNLTTKLVGTLENIGRNTIGRFLINPLKSGFQEYETQINSTQTIMANTGRSVEDVDNALNELNKYADLTIYDFTTMTKNAGMFTAALGKQPDALEKSTQAMKGIGNWAAYAGASSEDMARATYQLGQALTTGVINQQDWRSIENTGGMAGANFQEGFIKAFGEVNGAEMEQKLREQVEKFGFRGTLMKENAKEMGDLSGWFTNDVFFKAMEDFANNEEMTKAATVVKTFSQLMENLDEKIGTGWADIYKTLFGNFEQSKVLWTAVSDSIGGAVDAMMNAKKKVAQDFVAAGGREDIIEGLKNTFESIASVVKSIHSAFREVFPAATGQQLADAANKFKTFSESLKLTDDQLNRIKNTFQGVFTIIKIGASFIKSVFSGAFTILSSVFRLVSNIFFRITSPIGKLISSMGGVTKIFNVITVAAQHLADWIDVLNHFIDLLFDSVSKVGSSIKEALMPILKDISSSIGLDNLFKNIQNGFSSMINGFGSWHDALINSLMNIDTSGLEKVVSAIQNGIKGIATNAYWEHIPIIHKSLEGLKNVLQIVSDFLKKTIGDSDSLLEYVSKIGSLFEMLFKSFAFFKAGKMFSGIEDTIKNFSKITGGVSNIIKESGNLIKVEAIRTFADSIAILALGLSQLKDVDADQILSVVTILIGAMAAIEQLYEKMAEAQTKAEEAKKSSDFSSGNPLIDNIVNVAKGMLGPFSEGFTQLGQAAKIGSIAALVGVIGDVTASLSSLDLGSLEAVLGSLAGVATSLMGVLQAFSWLSKKTGYTEISGKLYKDLIGMAGLIYVCGKISETTLKYDFDASRLGNLIPFIGILGSAIGALEILGNTKAFQNNDNLSKMTGMISKTMISLVPLAIAFRIIAGIQIKDPASVYPLFGVVSGVSIAMAEIGSRTRNTEGIQAAANVVNAVGTALKGMGASLLLLSIGIKLLSGIQIDQGVADTAIGSIVIMGLVAPKIIDTLKPIMQRRSEANEMQGQQKDIKEIFKMISSILIDITKSLAVMAIAFKLLSTIQGFGANIGAFLDTLGIMATLVGGIFGLLAAVKNNSAGMSESEMEQSLKIFKEIKKVFLPLATAIAIISLGSALIANSGADAGQIAASAGVIAAAGGVIGAIVALITKLKAAGAMDVVLHVGDLITKIAEVFSLLLGVIGGFGGEEIVNELVKFSTAISENQDTIVNGLTTVLDILLNTIYNTIKNHLQQFVDLIIEAVKETLQKLTTYFTSDWQNILGGAGIITAIIFAFKGLNKLSLPLKETTKNIFKLTALLGECEAAVGVLMAEATGIAALIGNFSTWGPIQAGLDGFVQNMQSIMTAFGIIGGLAAGMLAVAIKFRGVIENAKLKDMSVVIGKLTILLGECEAAIGALAAEAIVLAAAIDGLLQLGLGDALVNLAEWAGKITGRFQAAQMEEVGIGITKFAASVSGIGQYKDDLDTATSALDSLSNVMNKLGVGGTQGGILHGLTELFTGGQNEFWEGVGYQTKLNAIGNLGTALVELAKGMAGLSTIVTPADQTVFDGITTSIGTMIADVKDIKTEDLDKVKNWLTNNGASLKTSISTFCTNIKDIKNVYDAEDVEAVKGVLKSIADIYTELPPASEEHTTDFKFAFLQYYNTDKTESPDIENLKKMIDDIGSLSKNIKSYAETVTGVKEAFGDPPPTEDDIKFPFKILQYMMEALQAMPNEGGVVQWWSGGPDIENLSKIIGYIGDLGPEVNELINGTGDKPGIKGLSDDYPNMAQDIEAIGTLITSLGSLTPLIERVGNIEQLEKFATKFPSIASSLREGLNNFAGGFTLKIKPFPGTNASDTISSVNSAADALTKLLDSLSDIRTAISNAQELTTALNDLKKAFDDIKSLDTVTINQKISTVATNLITTFQNVLGGTDINGKSRDLASEFQTIAHNWINSLAEGLDDETSIGYIGDYGGKIFDYIIGEDLFLYSVRLVQLTQVGEKWIEKVAEGLSDDTAKEYINNQATVLCDYVVGDQCLTSSDKLDKFKAVGTTWIEAIASAFDDKGNKKIIQDKIIEISKPTKETLTACSNAVKDVGNNIVDGVISGMDDKSTDLNNAVSRLASAANSKFEEENEIHSPSKVYREYGNYIGEGLILGIEDTMNSVSATSTNLAKTTVDAFQNASQRVSFDPVLKPLFDYSGINTLDFRFKSNINSMFSEPVNGIAGYVGRLSDNFAASSTMLYDEIEGFRQDIRDMYDSDEELALYVDSKKLASSIARPMNRQLNLLRKRGG